MEFIYEQSVKRSTNTAKQGLSCHQSKCIRIFFCTLLKGQILEKTYKEYFTTYKYLNFCGCNKCNKIQCVGGNVLAKQLFLGVHCSWWHCKGGCIWGIYCEGEGLLINDVIMGCCCCYCCCLLADMGWVHINRYHSGWPSDTRNDLVFSHCWLLDLPVVSATHSSP